MIKENIDLYTLYIQFALLIIQIPTLVALIVYVVKTAEMASASKKSNEIAEKTLLKIKEKDDAESMSLLNALIRELSYAQWTINYDYGRIDANTPRNKALALVKIKNIEEILLTKPRSLPLNENMLNGLQNYLQETTYLNSQIEEYRLLITSTQTNEVINTTKHILGEIKATCTPEDITEGSKTVSITKITKNLLADLSKIEIK